MICEQLTVPTLMDDLREIHILDVNQGHKIIPKIITQAVIM
jgi:hypothetical protein